MKVLNLFLIVSVLSSDLPLVSPRFKRRSSITCSEHSKNNTKSHSLTYNSNNDEVTFIEERKKVRMKERNGKWKGENGKEKKIK
jgi:hypothetical protein